MLKRIHSINAELAGRAHKRDVEVQLCGRGFSRFPGRMLANLTTLAWTD